MLSSVLIVSYLWTEPIAILPGLSIVAGSILMVHFESLSSLGVVGPGVLRIGAFY